MSEVEIFRRLAVALAIGLLIGLERGWQTRDEADRTRVAGLRTFALTGLLGGISALVASATSPLMLAAALFAYAGSVTAFSYLEAQAKTNFSVTGVLAGILKSVVAFPMGRRSFGLLVAVVSVLALAAILVAFLLTPHGWP